MAETMEFGAWLDTKPKEFTERMEAGDVGNEQNKWIAARMAYNAGIRAGLRLASERIAETIWNTSIEHTDRFGDVR